MEKIREIIRLKEQAHLSERAISRALKISRPIVKQYLVDIEKAGLDFNKIKDMDDQTLLEILQGKSAILSDRFKALSDKFEYFTKELKRTGVTLQRLWNEYRKDHPDGYRYSQFCYHFQAWRSTDEITMHIEHKAGDKMFVDFTGDHLYIVDRQTGEEIAVQVFVGVLGASQLTYVEALASQKKIDWITANQHALQYFGGVTLAIVPDCLKSAVTNGCKYEPEINPEYLDFARHYQTTILPARPHEPRDKALVEGAVRIVYAWIFASLRNRIFHSLEELNIAIQEELENYNAKPMQKLKVSRRQLFDEIEKTELKPLPNEPYVIRRINRLRAQFNYHIRLKEDDHYYSVPHRYRGKEMVVIYSDTVVEIFYQNQRIALHRRDRKPHGYTTVREHMPPKHQFVSDWNPPRFIRWAQQMGEHVQWVIEYILAQQQHPEQGYKTCLGILNLEKKFTKDRLEKACIRAINFQHVSYKSIRNILVNNLEDCQMEFFKPLPEHQNIRGRQYYQ